MGPTRDPYFLVGQGTSDAPAGAAERMQAICRAYLGEPSPAPTATRCTGCGHDPHPGRTCARTIPGMGGAVCRCDGAREQRAK